MNFLVIFIEFVTLVAGKDSYSSFLQTGQLKCDKHRDFPITASFQASSGDVYLWSNDYMTRLKILSTGELRVYDGYPKSIERWTKEDFLYPSKVKKAPPTSVYPESGGEMATFFLTYDTMDIDNSLLFSYSHERGGFIFERFSYIDFSFINPNVDYRIRYQSFITVGKQRKRYRAIYEISWTFKPNDTEHVDFEEKKLLKRKRLKHDPVVTGAVMVHHIDEWSLGYSFQGNYSVPLHAGIVGKSIDMYTIVETKYSETVGANKQWNDSIFSGVGIRNRFVIPNSFWFGCHLDEWCYRGYIDEATTNWNKQLLVFSGRWLRIHSDATSKPLESKYIHEYFNLNIPNFIDIAFTDRYYKLTLIMKEDRWFVLSYHRNMWHLDLKISRSLCQNESRTWSAITTEPDIFIFQAVNLYQVVTHRATTSNNTGYIFDYLGTKNLKDLVSDKVFPIEAAFKDPLSKTIYLVNSLFSYKIKSKQFWKTKSNSKLEFSHLFGCEPNFEANPLNVNLEQYKNRLEKGFQIQSLFLVSTELTFKEWITEIIKTSTFYLFMTVVVLSVIIVVVFLYIFTKHKWSKKRSKKESKQKTKNKLK